MGTGHHHSWQINSPYSNQGGRGADYAHKPITLRGKMLSDLVCPSLKFQNRQCPNLHIIKDQGYLLYTHPPLKPTTITIVSLIVMLALISNFLFSTD